ncbi:MAG: DUF4982 domain-containing protein [Bacteroidales bacterium]|nr:DUF4982 domain-containing protein [Bacteroidales bacterium]MCF8404885.1 DUF4982 domain-containing protein [Bacteroidales bacterium]
MKKLLWILTLFILVLFSSSCINQQQFEPVEINFNKNWKFSIAEDSLDAFLNFDKWENVNLPHTPKIEPLIVNEQWQGICWYRKSFHIPANYLGKQFFLRFEGAMNIADVWINGTKKIKHYGGYLPFIIDFTDEVYIGKSNEVIVRLDNRDNPVTGPKPLDILDFNMYGGLYRDVSLSIKNQVFITDPILENSPAGGGIFITYPEVNESMAEIKVQTHARNAYEADVAVSILHEVWKDDILVSESQSDLEEISSNKAITNIRQIKLLDPELWSPQTPEMYVLKTKLIYKGKVVDQLNTKLGIRRFDFVDGKLNINGKEQFLRGVNRHQEYPYVGYALSNEAQYRDAVKIKEAGFDYVRLSHYPHSPAFMDACDELGLVVIDAILGWQYFSEDSAFQAHVFQTAKDLIRRDRNHPCVLAWEVSLNESWMPETFIDSLTSIAHKEYPGDQCFTAGWQEYGYDIYLQARQHRLSHYEDPEKPYVVSEYGDWEYYAMNAGLEQNAWQDLLQEERTSRQLLSFGEKRLLQQATNIQEAHNDNFNTPAFADGYWVMFDYNRGYADDLEASGIMSINRLPKFSYYFFQSQRDPYEISDKYKSGPMVKIASYWNDLSSLDVRVFSNCEEVALYLNDSLISKQLPSIARISDNLTHPPFIFHLDQFKKGTLKAIGFIESKEVAQDIFMTPLDPVSLQLRLDESSKSAISGVNDVLFVYATLTDVNGTTVPLNDVEVEFSIHGDVSLVSPKLITTEAGIASILIQIGEQAGKIKIHANANNILIGELEFASK